MDRIERHDIINALVLAVALLFMALLLSIFGNKLFSTLDEQPVITKTTTPEVTSPTVSSTTPTTDPTTTEPELAPVHTPAEVKVIVANSARISGIATLATNSLTPVGYDVLSPTNGNTVPNSVVYYVEGYEGDAIQVANLLGMAETAVAPMPASIDFNAKDAHLAAVIGADTALR